jgi:hypothetical protein
MKYIFLRELTLERNPVDVSNVGKPSCIPVKFVFMKELILERNAMDLSNVQKSFNFQ